ncbi:MAG: putative pre6S rRNA nuclease [Actinomycetota bacterium]|nr:putative pre6S rRNA nuclease [Actinomycetota bacterium]
MTPAGRVLGVDLGSRRIGLALSDPGRQIASPHRVLRRAKQQVDDHRAILAAARENDAVAIVVGLPISLSGDLGPAARATLAEVEELRAAASPLPVETYDERLTTVTAERTLQEARMGREARRQVVDKVAAAVMLQSWLESNR